MEEGWKKGGRRVKEGWKKDGRRMKEGWKGGGMFCGVVKRESRDKHYA